MDTLKEKVTEMEKEEIIRALANSDWVMARAARKLGITERMIAYKMKKYRILRGIEHRTASEDYRP
ncbi:MAG: helix-turn-helix domain-containing protein [Dissulfurispiraceae bacterium]